MRSLFEAGKLLLLDMASTFFFLALYLWTNNISLSVALGVALGIAQIGWQFARKKPIETMEWLSLFLVMGSGAATLNQPEEIEHALQAISSAEVDVVIVLQTSMLLSGRDQIAAVALARKLPTVFGYEPHVVAGGLISYGIDLIQCSYRISNFVDKILHGTKPSDLPVEFPTKMLLAVNLKTARALGITISPTILGRADRVIE
jgi:hypothetical protein